MQLPLDLHRFELRSKEENVRIVSLAYDLVLYTDRILSEVPEAVLYAYDRFLRIVPPGTLRWYLTESMSKHKAITPRSMDMLGGWLKLGSSSREIINIELRDGQDFTNTADFVFFVYGGEPTYPRHRFEANMIRLCFPPEWGATRHLELYHLAKDICHHFPFQSGHSGYVLQTSKYVQEESEFQAFKLGMQFPCVDIRNEITDLIAVRDAIKGVNWLTMLCDDFVDRIRGRLPLSASLPPSAEIIRVDGGVILKAGNHPILGDLDTGEDISLYKAVYRLVEPLQRAARDKYSSFLLPGGDHVAKTQRWLRRLGDD
ncbi:uncharacterized protein DUF3396 [Nitrosospira sp. Nsp5]|uniref:DUF3396 domain-containing protein n=1 Tax=Nitrosospira multiformis TaxID=1231 RepID=A0ABY0TDU4_9PROT|nr:MULTISPECIES: type VI immunity family protein [Nitrosospira]PTR08972.1 uncharacterized protein DUF3396 [Nitrosospira sp. Nsp5]SDQ68126.1 Protein of unknown function [Nitrosospira multiformis]